MRKIMLVVDEFKEMVALEGFFRRLGFDVLSLGKEVLVNDALLRFTPDLVIASARGRSVDGIRLAGKLRKLVPPPRISLLFSQQSGGLALADDQMALVDAVIETPFRPKQVIPIVAQLLGLDAAPLLAKHEKISTAKLTTEEELLIVSNERPMDEAIHFNRQPLAESDDAVTLRGTSTIAPPSTSIIQPPSQSAGAAFDSSLEPAAENNEGPQERNVSIVQQAPTQGEWDPQATPGIASTARSARSDRYAKFLQDNDEAVNQVLPRDLAQAAMDKLKKDSESEKKELDDLDAAKREFAKALFVEGVEQPPRRK